MESKEQIAHRIKKRRFQIELFRKNRSYDPHKHEKGHVKNISGKYIIAPKIVSIYEQPFTDGRFSETLNFIYEIKKFFCKTKTVIDFRHTERITAAAMLMIYATLETCRESGYIESFIIFPRNSPSSTRNIKLSNIVSIIKNREINYKFSSHKPLPIISGVRNNHFEDIINHIQNMIYKNRMPEETEHFYSDAVSETINNVGLHAYPSRHISKRKWWLICRVIDKQLYLAIYDMGVGIPETVLNKEWFITSLSTIYPSSYSELKEKFPEHSNSLENYIALIPAKAFIKDHQMIYLAMTGDVSGTKEPKHGQGSKSIKALVQETKNGKLWAFSGKGLYTLQQRNPETELTSANQDKAEALYELPNRIPGTLIQWNIKLL
jgi:hypothetical protein